jgi:hypothetical protein
MSLCVCLCAFCFTSYAHVGMTLYSNTLSWFCVNQHLEMHHNPLFDMTGDLTYDLSHSGPACHQRYGVEMNNSNVNLNTKPNVNLNTKPNANTNPNPNKNVDLIIIWTLTLILTLKLPRTLTLNHHTNTNASHNIILTLNMTLALILTLAWNANTNPKHNRNINLIHNPK